MLLGTNKTTAHDDDDGRRRREGLDCYFDDSFQYYLFQKYKYVVIKEFLNTRL